MDNKIKNIIEKLTKENKTISAMESCTGGGLVNSITNTEGASRILKFSAITYSDEYKIKMGVNKEIISQYSVYSIETADQMSNTISKYTNSNYGIGITGKIKGINQTNNQEKDNFVYLSIYDNDQNIYYHKVIELTENKRLINKNKIIEVAIDMLNNIINS